MPDPNRLVLSYLSDSDDRIGVDTTDSNNLRTVSIEQFIGYGIYDENDVEIATELQQGDLINLELDYELEGVYADSICSFYLTQNRGARTLVDRVTGISSKTGSRIIQLEPGIEWGIVQELIFTKPSPATAVNRVFVNGAHNEFANIIRIQVLSGNYSPLQSNIGTTTQASN